jgi:ATP-binding cassette subfamily B protein
MRSRWARLNDRYRRVSGSFLWRLLAEQRRWLLAMVGLAGCSFLVAIGVALSIKNAVDLAMIEQIAPLETYTDALVGLAFLGLLVGLPLRQVVARLGFHLEYQLRLWVYEKVLAMHPTALDVMASGQAMTRAMSDLTMLELATALIPPLAVALIILLGIAVVLVAQDPLLGVIALLSIPINLRLVMRIRKPLFGLSWTILNRRAEVTTAIDEAVRGARVVKAFAREDDERRRVATAARATFAAAVNRIRLTARYELVLRVAPVIIDAALIALGARRVIDGQFTIGELLLFLIFSGVFTGLARSFEQIMTVWQLARSGARRIYELIEMAPAAPALPPPPAPGEPVVVSGEGFSLELVPGELVVLDGALPPGGIAGAGVLVVEGDAFLFGTTVGDNLRLADRDAGDERLHAVLQAAAVDDVIANLGGLDGQVGDRGLTLSGGQRQRVALARALVDPPHALVLHDALSAVNPALELRILRQVRALEPELAIVVVASRPLIAAEADRTAPTGVAPADGPDAATALLDAMASARPEQLLPPELLEALETVPPERDEPRVDELTAVASDHAPTVPNVLRPFTRAAVLAGLLLLMTTLVGLVPPGLIQLAVDGIRDRSTSTADAVAAGMIVCGGIVGVLTYLYKLRAARVTEGVMYLLRRRAFQRLTRLGVDFYDRELPGKVAARVVHDLDRISAFVDTGVYLAGTAAIILVSTIVVMLVWNATVAAVMLSFLPFMVVATVIEVPLANRAYDRARARLGIVIARLQEDIAGRYVIAAFDARDQTKERFAEAAWDLRLARRRSVLISNTHGEVIAMFVGLAMAAVLATAGRLTVDGSLSVGAAVTLELYLVIALAPIPQLSDVLQSYLAARASFRTLGEPFRAEIVPPEPAAPRPACPPLTGALRFEGVTFTYPGTERTVLLDVDLDVEAGALVALVGPTGAGKSSLAKLLGRVYDPSAGCVRVDGIDIREHDLGSYRRRLGVVPQDGFCFRGTLTENLAYGRPDASRADIEAAMAAVGAEPVTYAVAGGLSGYVDEEGRNLSARERQLVALARAWLLDPDVLVLDEATSALEADAERRVLDAVRRRGRTTVFVTHRESVAEQADLVIVVDQGRLQAVGPHDELLGDDWYRDLWPRQRQRARRATKAVVR